MGIILFLIFLVIILMFSVFPALLLFLIFGVTGWPLAILSVIIGFVIYTWWLNYEKYN